MSRYTVTLDHRRARNATTAGGKGANLALLTSQGFRVPRGFVVTPEAFRRYLRTLTGEAIAGTSQQLESELGQSRAAIQRGSLPRQVSGAILKAVRKLEYPVAVRSSMIREDAANASYAGQLDTVLHVAQDVDLLRSVKRCWASVFNWRLARYLHERGNVDLNELLTSYPVAVVIQEMVPARAAGVAFSVDPISGEDRVVIESVPGLGDGLVSGREEPDRYLVRKANGAITADIVAGRAPALSEAQVSALAELVQQVHKAMGGPQDIEWALSDQGFHLLQSRPVTSLFSKHVYGTSMVSEMLPGLIKPLVWSVSAQAKLQHVMGRIFTEMIGPNDIDFTTLAKRIHGRIYADNTLLGSLFERMGLPPNFFEMMSRDESATRRRSPPINLSTLRTMLRVGSIILRYSRFADEIEGYLASHSEALAPYQIRDWSSLPAAELLPHLAELRRLYSESLWMNFVGPVNMMLRNMLLDRVVRKWSPGTVTGDLVRGLMGMKALDSNQGLGALAEQARVLGPEAIRMMGEGDISAIRSTLSATTAGAALLTSVDVFLEDYGFLSAAGTDLSRTPWIEDPLVIWRSIARRASLPSLHRADDAVKIRSAAQSEARAMMYWWQRRVFDRLLTATIRYIDLRERTSVHISQDSYQLRRLLLAVGDDLVHTGRLESREDIFYLHLDELERLVYGTLSGAQASSFVAERREQLAASAEIELPDVIYGDLVPTTHIEFAAGQTLLSGISGCSGVAQGQARIVLDPADAPVSLTPDDILVVPFTDVSWTPLFAGIGGLVAETGGQLSHSAIVAREFGLPAVVNVKQATRLIREGQTVIVDGDHGNIYLR